MKLKYINIIVITSLCGNLLAQSNETNYIKTIRPLAAGDRKNVQTTIRYYDGLGRHTETVSNVTSTEGKTLHVVQEYDALGRISRQWAPVIGTTQMSPLSVSDVASSSKNTYENDAYAYSDNSYDVLGNLIWTSTPGAEWKNRNAGKTTSYSVNDATGSNSVKKYTIDESRNTVKSKSNYAKGALRCVEMKDEDGHTLKQYIDFRGLLILERRSTNNDTYYVYNDLGQLRYVLQPMYQEEASIEKYAFQYTYDNRGRVRTKTIPGSSAITYWYDDANKVVCMQDGRLEASLYRIFLYDVLGRLCIQATYPDTIKTSIIPYVEFKYINSFKNTGYQIKNLDLKAEKCELEVVNYYDTPAFLNVYPKSSFIAKYYTPTPFAGRMTASWQNTTDGCGILTCYHYDRKGRPDITIKMGGPGQKIQVLKDVYNFAGDIAQETFEIYKDLSGSELEFSSTTTNDYYPNTTMLKEQSMTVKGRNLKATTIKTQSLTYDAFGRVVKNTRGNAASNMEFVYDNLHGWVKEISTGRGFLQKIHRGGDVLNGSIASMEWRMLSGETTRKYDYSYDELNRLTNAQYSEVTVDAACYRPVRSDNLSLLTPVFECLDEEDKYGEKMSYDANSNIITVERKGMRNDKTYGLIDDIEVKYNGNQRISAEDRAEQALSYTGASDFVDKSHKASEYVYDKDGALRRDFNRRLDNIQYDNLGNLKQVLITNGHRNYIFYNYSSDGTKNRVTHKQFVGYSAEGYDVFKEDVTDYYGPYIVKNGNPQQYNFAGGYISFSANGSLDKVHYYVRDYQGNVRQTVSGNVVEQENHYYPYGGIIGDLSLNEELQDYKFEGKELDRTFGLDWYDIDARQYDAIGVPSWHKLDPLAEKYYNISPYAYCAGNPVNLVDMHGDSLTIIGEQKEAALEQLQGEVEGSITLYLDNETGRVSYTKKLNVKKLKGNARKLATVINDKNVNVMVSTRPTNNKRDCTSTNYEMAGGAFMGNELSPDGKSATAYQEVNPLFLGAADAANGTKGTLMLHEVTEAYYGGLNAIEEQKSAGPAITSKENLEYRNAHNMATPQMPISFYYEDPSGTKRSKDRFFQANRKVYYIGSRPFYQVYLFR